MRKAEAIAEASRLVDELGALKARVAALTDQEAELKHALRLALTAAGKKEAEGETWRATVSVAVRGTKDKIFKALVEKLVAKHTSPQYRAAHTEFEDVVSVRVVARTRKDTQEAA